MPAVQELVCLLNRTTMIRFVDMRRLAHDRELYCSPCLVQLARSQPETGRLLV